MKPLVIDLCCCLEEPRSDFQRLIRELAEDAMSVTHHDAAESEPGYIHEVQAMERRFRKRLASFRRKRKQ